MSNILAKNDTILKTKSDIENYFKTVQFIHSGNNTDRNNEQTIFKNTTLNGSFTKTYLLCEIDDMFIGFNHELIKINNLSQFWSFYNEHRTNSNIVLDYRMTNYIIYAILKYEDDVLIFDVSTGKVKNIYWFCSKYFQIQTNELTLNQIKQLLIAHLLFSSFVSKLNINWNNIQIIKSIKQNDQLILEHDSNKNIFDMLINYIKIQQASEVSTKNISLILSNFNKYFSETAFEASTSPQEINKEWNIPKLKLYEFYVSLSILKNNNFIIYGLSIV